MGAADVVELIAAVVGAAILVLVWGSVLRTTLIPRRSSSRMARWTVRGCAAIAIGLARRLPARTRDHLLDFSVPVGLFLMATGWLTGIALGFWLLAVAVGPAGQPALAAAAVLTAVMVLGAFVVYVVHFMHAYRHRERMISLLPTEVRLVTDADKLLADHLRSGSRDSLDDYFARWAAWLADVRDSHVSYPGLIYHRSVGGLCWPKAALIVMDTAALVEAVAPRWAPLHTRVLLDVGSSCLQRLARHVGVTPPAMRVSLHGREERAFGDTMRLATRAGLPEERDIDSSWEVFQDIRVRYAPYAVLIGARLLTSW